MQLSAFTQSLDSNSLPGVPAIPAGAGLVDPSPAGAAPVVFADLMPPSPVPLPPEIPADGTALKRDAAAGAGGAACALGATFPVTSKYSAPSTDPVAVDFPANADAPDSPPSVPDAPPSDRPGTSSDSKRPLTPAGKPGSTPRPLRVAARPETPPVGSVIVDLVAAPMTIAPESVIALPMGFTTARDNPAAAGPAEEPVSPAALPSRAMDSKRAWILPDPVAGVGPTAGMPRTEPLSAPSPVAHPPPPFATPSRPTTPAVPFAADFAGPVASATAPTSALASVSSTGFHLERRLAAPEITSPEARTDPLSSRVPSPSMQMVAPEPSAPAPTGRIVFSDGPGFADAPPAAPAVAAPATSSLPLAASSSSPTQFPDVRDDLAAVVDLAVAPTDNRPRMAVGPRGEKIAAVRPERAEPFKSERKPSVENFLNAGVEELKRGGPSLGIDVAKNAADMTAAPSPHRNVSDETSPFALSAVLPPSSAADAAPKSNAAPADPIAATAHRAVDAVLASTERFTSGSHSSVNLKLSVGGSDLDVRVEIRGGAVHATFRTDSPELRTALAQEWQASGARADDHPLRLAPPVFTAGDRSGSDSGAAFSGDQSRQSRDPGARPAAEFVLPGFSRGRSAATAAAAGAVALLPSVPATNLHLHAFA